MVPDYLAIAMTIVSIVVSIERVIVQLAPLFKRAPKP